jgi:hypothetical protein
MFAKAGWAKVDELEYEAMSEWHLSTSTSARRGSSEW